MLELQDKNPLSSNSVSVTMIVKNEAENIRDAVASAKTFADEIIINDTGSTDGTRDILDSLGIHWFQSQWQNDFSLARNQCLKRIRGTWTFWMDADDRVPVETSRLINELKTCYPGCAYGFEIVNVEGSSGMGARFAQVRMFPNHPLLRFQGRIHEQISHNINNLNLKEIYQQEEVHHYGYQSEILKKEKALRNLEIILVEKDRLRSEPMFASSLGDCYYILEEWEKGIHAYLKIRNIPASLKKNADIYHEVPCLVGLGYMKMKKWEQAMEYLIQAEREKPLKLESKYYQAKIYQSTEDIHRAIIKYQEITYMAQPITGTINRYDSLHMNSYAELTQLYLKSGRFAEAEDTVRRMIDSYPNIVEGYYFLGRVYENKGLQMEAIKAYLEGIKLNPSVYWPLHNNLLSLLQRMGTREVFESSFRLASKFFPEESENFLGTGRK